MKVREIPYIIGGVAEMAIDLVRDPETDEFTLRRLSFAAGTGFAVLSGALEVSTGDSRATNYALGAAIGGYLVSAANKAYDFVLEEYFGL